MTFANVCVNQEQLTWLSHLLLAAFPGCTIHQSRNPMRTMQHLSDRKVDAVFVDADSGSDWIPLFRKHKSNPTVYLLCPQERWTPPEAEDIRSQSKNFKTLYSPDNSWYIVVSSVNVSIPLPNQITRSSFGCPCTTLLPTLKLNTPTTEMT